MSARRCVLFYMIEKFYLGGAVLGRHFLVAARKQVITKHQTGNNNQDSKETVAHEKHDTHTDTNPE